mgnify:CR=1 FL=1
MSYRLDHAYEDEAGEEEGCHTNEYIKIRNEERNAPTTSAALAITLSLALLSKEAVSSSRLWRSKQSALIRDPSRQLRRHDNAS